MSASPTSRRRARLPWVLALLLVAFAPPGGRDVIHFLASFDPVPSDPAGNDFLAKGGEIVVQGPPDVFALVLDAPDDGGVLVKENVFGSSATLIATLDEPAAESQLNVSMELTPDGGLSPLIIALADDDGGEMIDITFDEDDDGGIIQVGGITDAFDPTGSDPGATTFTLDAQFTEHLFGVRSWKVTLTGAFGVQSYQGVVPGLGPLELAELRIVRPGNVRGGTWLVDDVVVSSPPDPSLTNQ